MASNLLKRFPNTKEEAMKEKFPLVKWNEVTRFVRTLFNSLNTLNFHTGPAAFNHVVEVAKAFTLKSWHVTWAQHWDKAQNLFKTAVKRATCSFIFRNSL